MTDSNRTTLTITFDEYIVKNVTGGSNVVIYCTHLSPHGIATVRYLYHTVSYANRTNARRAIRTGAALRRALWIERGI